MEQTRIEALLQAMTLEEKLTLLTGPDGSMDSAPIPRLGIPGRHMTDGPHGVRTTPEDNCTAFPGLSCLGATWDREAARKMGAGIAEDCIEHGVFAFFGPGVNLKRTPLCGRNFEYFAEDPVLTGELAAGYIRGAQSRGVSTSLKHFAMNNQEIDRMDISVEADLRVLRELYLRPFEIAVKKGDPWTVMCSYNKIQSVWNSENPFLLTRVLRDEWGYGHCTISDWSSVRHSARALMAGLELQMPNRPTIHEEIKAGLETGAVTMERVDEAVRRALNFLLRPLPVHETPYDREAQHEAARQVAAEGMVLLKNDRKVLPLTAEKYKKIAVLGEYAEKPLVFGQGSAEVYTQPEWIDSPLVELKTRLGDAVELRYLPIYKRRELPGEMIWVNRGQWEEFVADCDAVVMFLGSMESEDTEQFDRRTIELNPNFSYVVEAVAHANPNVAVVVQSGSAMALGRIAQQVPAIVQMWIAGEAAGSAIADVLTGAVNPSGKLSETFPLRLRTDLDYPGDGKKVCYREGFDIGYRYYDKHPEEICFPFGHGLSYTTFRYEDFSVRQKGDKLELSLTVHNDGDVDGREVVQVYVRKEESIVTRCEKDLKAFEKVFVPAGGRTEVTMTLDLQDLAYFNLMLDKWVVEPGEYIFFAAASSRDIRCTARLTPDCEEPYTIDSYAVASMG